MLTPAAPPVTWPTNTEGLRWLATLHPDPRQPLDDWHAGQLAHIPLGRFHILRTTATLGELALRMLAGTGWPVETPVLSDQPVMDFFVAPTRLIWKSEGVGRLLKTGHLECPPPGRGSALKWRSHWLVQPDGSGRLLKDIEGLVECVLRAYKLEVDRSEQELRAPNATAAAAFFASARQAVAGVH